MEASVVDVKIEGFTSRKSFEEPRVRLGSLVYRVEDNFGLFYVEKLTFVPAFGSDFTGNLAPGFALPSARFCVLVQ
jgi:hypothetical protein